MEKIKYSFKNEKDQKELELKPLGYQLKSNDVCRIAPGKSLLMKTGIILESNSNLLVGINGDLEKSKRDGLLVLNPLGVTSYSGENEIEILIHNISNKTAVINYGESVGFLYAYSLGSEKMESPKEEDSEPKSEEPVAKKVAKKAKPKKVKLEELISEE